MADANKNYAIFIDMMGFADALEDLSDDEQIALNEQFIADSSMLFGRDGLLVERRQMTPAVTQIIRRYKRFQQNVNYCINHGVTTRDSFVVFSDSAFAVVQDLPAAVALASTLMYLCLTDDIPVRIGVARGAFTRLAFSTTSWPEGRLVMLAPFLGTAIVRAYRAQACTCMGFRVFVHPSIDEEALEESPLHSEALGLVDLSETERCKTASQEVNFMLHGKWPPASESRRLTLETAIQHLSAMKQGVNRPRALLHFETTERTIRRLHGLIQNEPSRS